MSKNKKVGSADEIPTEVGDKKIKNDDEVVEENNCVEEIELLKQQSEEYKAGWMRAQADYQNLQREVEAKRAEWVKMSEVQILEDFIPVYDNFKKAFADHTDTQIYADDTDNADNENVKRWNNWKQGIGYIMKQFGDILKDYKIEEIKTVGEQFNPELHEAVGEESPSADAQGKKPKEGEITKEVDAGYKVGERVIKCARVIISK
ncbi:MAG: nucleotide exchange factor GrpE [bacterium]|nr:nucleotide exchange factor GrpE [bacterium]